MNSILNNQLLLLTTVGTLMMNGCVAQENFQKSSFAQPKNSVKKSKTWKNITQAKSDCPDCYASGVASRTVMDSNAFHAKERITYDYSKAPAQFDNNHVEYQAKVVKPSYVDNVIDTQNYGTYDYTITPSDTYIEPNDIKITPRPAYVNSSRDSFQSKLTSDTTIQVGAFRHYSGAEKIANKYRLLLNKYSVRIETGTKGGTPIHRVRISGFHSKGQAKLFIERYASNDAFLVRR